MQNIDVVIIGAGAAGLMCAIEAGKRGRRVLVLEHNNQVGKKILMSGGGYCNFTNYDIEAGKYLSHNPHFCKSALSRYTQWDFISFIEQQQIAFHEKTLGQLFFDDKAKVIVQALLDQCSRFKIDILLNTHIESVNYNDKQYITKTNKDDLKSETLVVASGGLSIPTMGASPFGYQLATQFELKVYPTRAALVPFTLHVADKERLATLSGIGIDSIISCNDVSFREAFLFTHRGLSGPAILQISSYWQPGNTIEINLLPTIDLAKKLTIEKQNRNRALIKTILNEYLPKRVVSTFINPELANMCLQDITNKDIQHLGECLNQWKISPNGTEGYRTAEVTLGGVDCDTLSSKTMEVKNVTGLYFIGEVVDVSGWLGGYNFQWAWSSGWAAGQVC